MKKIYLKTMVAALLLLCSTVASADHVKINGITYEIYTDFKIAEVIEREQTGDIIIPEEIVYNDVTYNVTAIGYSAFAYCTGLTSITIPNSVTAIKQDAFIQCDNLKSIELPNSINVIGIRAFNGCRELTNITIPNSVIKIEEGAFAYCGGLTSIIVENGNTKYDSRDNCNAIIETSTNTLIRSCKSTIIPSSVTTIGTVAFAGCTGLTSITIPNSVTTIGAGAFAGCTGLTSITIPNSVAKIEFYPFSNCTNLTSIILENGNTKYDSRDNCNAIIETATNTLIAGCSNTTIPNSVTRIEECAFIYCNSLTSITVPNSVTSIGGWVFDGCKSLTDVYCLATTVPETSSYTFYNSNYKNAILHVPAETIDRYRTTAPWSDFGTIVAIEGSEEDTDKPAITTGEAIDLGLPSGIKWASCNIGATTPEEHGGYYAWGEIEEKESYKWSTYKWCNGIGETLIKYCTDGNYGNVDNKTTLDPKDDVAYVKWGGNWRIPTLDEIKELINNCNWEWTVINSVNGCKVTGPNGNCIFLPAAGYRDGTELYGRSSFGGYLSNSLDSSYSNFYGLGLGFDSSGCGWSDGNRCCGYTVRPVYDDGSSTSIEIIIPEANNENTIYDLRGQKLTEITAPGIYIVNGKKVIVK